MHVTLVQVTVKPECVDAFIAATADNHAASIEEPGNRRFDVLQSPESPCDFILYEAYDTPQAAAAHKLTTHYLAWRRVVEHMMAQPRRGLAWHGLLPRS